jgi:hypothetical protein
MADWNGVLERVLALGPPPWKDRGRRRLLRQPAGPFTPLLDDPLTEDEVSFAEREFGVVFPVTDELLAGLSPLQYDHINFPAPTPSPAPNTGSAPSTRPSAGR